MHTKEVIRKRVWFELQEVARPDSRFHWDFNEFIPDFDGSQACTDRLGAASFYREAGCLLVTPDNSLAGFRERCLTDGKILVVPTYGLGRGFLQVHRRDVPPGQEPFAATLDGLDRYARPYPVLEPGGVDLPLPQALVSGASVLNREGVRLGQGPSYFDIEWLILAYLGAITPTTLVITAVHDCQVVDWPTEPLPYTLVTDLIITPTTTLDTRGRFPRPEPAALRHLPWGLIQRVPLLNEIYHQRKGPADRTGRNFNDV
jgi:5-formyltetrahydrofolate cyclo-ligase